MSIKNIEIKPLVSVVMSVYNGEKYLKDAIESILNQTYKKIEFIIIDDGSTDKSLKIIESYKDKRIKLIKNDGNKGLIYSLNKGLKLSLGKYIARMDADDISLNNRFELQLKYMEENSNTAVLGTQFYFFYENNKIIKKKYGSNMTTEEIKAKLFFENAVAHPTVFMRKDILEKNEYTYNYLHRGVEDYGLWNLISQKYKIENLNIPLLNYRLLKNSITSNENRNIEGRFEVLKEINKINLKNLGIDLSNDNLRILFEIQFSNYIKKSRFNLKEKESFLSLILNKNKKNGIYNLDIFEEVCAKKFYRICLYTGKYEDYKNSKFYKILKIDKMKFYQSLAKVIILKYVKKLVR